MKDVLISQYIDDELDLDEKIVFVERIHSDTAFKDATVELIMMEKELRSVASSEEDLGRGAPIPTPKRWSTWVRATAAASFAAVVLAAAIFFAARERGSEEVQEPAQSFRFVLHEPDAQRVEMVGDFTKWRRIPLERVGSEGYWEVHAMIAPGDHRYVFIVDGTRMMADPTVLEREKDEFGSENSIVSIGGQG